LVGAWARVAAVRAGSSVVDVQVLDTVGDRSEMFESASGVSRSSLDATTARPRTHHRWHDHIAL